MTFVSAAARTAIADLGFDPSYGARPIKRVIQQKIQNELATEILKNHIGEGSKAVVDYQLDGFVFSACSPADSMSDSREREDEPTSSQAT